MHASQLTYIDLTPAVIPAYILLLLLNRPPEEALAAVTSSHAVVVMTASPIATHHTEVTGRVLVAVTVVMDIPT